VNEKITVNRHETHPNRQELLRLAALLSMRNEYDYFAGHVDQREEAKHAFLSGQEYTPSFSYPRLDHIHDDFQTGDMPEMSHETIYNNLLDMKGNDYKVIQELDAAAQTGSVHAAEYKLYADSKNSKLNKILLVEAAQYLREDNSNTTRMAW
jgi:hypothetical protein